MKNGFPFSRKTHFLLIALFLSGCLFSCSSSPFNAEKPYAVLVGKYRSIQTATNSLNRLQDDGLPAYLFPMEVPGEGKWYTLFLGSSDVLEDMMAKKIDYEDAYGLKQLEIVNFNQLKDQILESSEMNVEEKINTDSPDLPYALNQLLTGLPYNSTFQVGHFSFFQPLDSVSFSEFPELRNATPDLPRGISKEQLLKLSKGFVEVVYQDPLRKKEVTVDLAIIKPGGTPADSLAYRFGKEILDTRYYETEEMVNTEVEAEDGTWKGYMVTISPRKNQLKRYLILVDELKEKICFLQHSDESGNQMLAFARSFGADESITAYTNLYNGLNLLAGARPVNEELAHLSLDMLAGIKGNNGAFFNGQSRTIYYFYHPSDGLWESRFTFFEEASLSQQLFADIFLVNKKGKEEIEVTGGNGLISFAYKYSPSQKKRLKLPDEVQIQTRHFLGFISNGKKSELDKADLLLRTKCFQLDAEVGEPGLLQKLSKM